MPIPVIAPSGLSWGTGTSPPGTSVAGSPYVLITQAVGSNANIVLPIGWITVLATDANDQVQYSANGGSTWNTFVPVSITSPVTFYSDGVSFRLHNTGTAGSVSYFTTKGD